MNKQEIVLKYYREHKSYSVIATELGIDWRTVKKYLEQYSASRKALRSENLTAESTCELQTGIVEKPTYKQGRGRSKRALTPEIKDQIDLCIAQNKTKLETGYRKQLMNKQAIYLQLKEGGINIGYTTVCNYIREQADKTQEAFIKQLYQPGSVCEFDWGEVQLDINGTAKKYQLAVFTPAYSNYRYARLYHRQDGYCLSDAHACFFEHAGGSFAQMVYDNMRTVIRKFIGRNEKEPTVLLLQLSTYYRFGYRFCNARRGNEKGHVERSVSYVRSQAFSTYYKFDSLEDAQNHLDAVLTKINSKENPAGISAKMLLEEEQKVLMPAGPKFEHFISLDLHVDKYSTVCHQSNHYSVPDYLTGKVIQVKVYPWVLKCSYQNHPVCTHAHRYTPTGWYIELEHYLQTMLRKPGALPNSLAMDQAEETVREIFQKYFSDNPRQFIELLLWGKEKNISAQCIQQKINFIIENALGKIDFDKIRYLTRQTGEPKIGQQHAISSISYGEIETASLALINQIGSLQQQFSN